MIDGSAFYAHGPLHFPVIHCKYAQVNRFNDCRSSRKFGPLLNFLAPVARMKVPAHAVSPFELAMRDIWYVVIEFLSDAASFRSLARTCTQLAGLCREELTQERTKNRFARQCSIIVSAGFEIYRLRYSALPNGIRHGPYDVRCTLTHEVAEEGIYVNGKCKCGKNVFCLL